VDDETWLFHLQKADYSRWIAHALGDKELAEEITKIEQDGLLSARESRDRVKNAILQKYTAPA
jgi:expansin (peptidoglycan-binding protein)